MYEVEDFVSRCAESDAVCDVEDHSRNAEFVTDQAVDDHQKCR